MDPTLTPLPFYQAMAKVADTSYILTETLDIMRVNPAWTHFAHANDGQAMLERWGRGSNLLDAISADLREPFRAMFESALITNVRVEYDYDCSSGLTRRMFRMLAIPVDGRFLVVTHAQRVEGDVRELIEAGYQRDGIVVMCADCKRVRAVDRDDRWDWFAAPLDQHIATVSHGSCPLCATLALLSLRG